MTRGKEVQELIKSNKKSARERFEDAGWEHKNVDSKIHYCECNNTITFFKDDKKVMAQWFEDSMAIDMETLKLIIQQCKELGWL